MRCIRLAWLTLISMGRAQNIDDCDVPNCRGTGCNGCTLSGSSQCGIGRYCSIIYGTGVCLADPVSDSILVVCTWDRPDRGGYTALPPTATQRGDICTHGVIPPPSPALLSDPSAISDPGPQPYRLVSRGNDPRAVQPAL